ncbi:hypothetical protein [Rheinheimera faecalis]|uniref:hypothetical protein n=1 Tax=Rheinheimera faecalis TaxID=2901141 RepID=UPI001E5FBAD1|nr:hypothetical protein [Rheinheimera faecalis]
MFPLEYCAARFLRQWELREEKLYVSISCNPSALNVTEALSYFQVARNFKGLNTGIFVQNKILTALINVKGNSSLATPQSKVIDLAKAFEEHFSQYNISSASKLLWLSYRDPYVIYDKRAVNTLRKLGHKNIGKDYLKYFEAWKIEFLNLETSIEDAIINLKYGRSFMPYTNLSDTEIELLAKKQWFKERVFDIFLWELNGKILQDVPAMSSSATE